jgi:hypothetical protein
LSLAVLDTPSYAPPEQSRTQLDALPSSPAAATPLLGLPADAF